MFHEARQQMPRFHRFQVVTQGVPKGCLGFFNTPHIDKNDVIQVDDIHLARLDSLLETKTKNVGQGKPESKSKSSKLTDRRDKYAVGWAKSMMSMYRRITDSSGKKCSGNQKEEKKDFLPIPTTYLWCVLKKNPSNLDFEIHAYFVMDGLGWSYRLRETVGHSFYRSLFSHHTAMRIVVHKDKVYYQNFNEARLFCVWCSWYCQLRKKS